MTRARRFSVAAVQVAPGAPGVNAVLLDHPCVLPGAVTDTTPGAWPARRFGRGAV
jgi:hypothetical protein